MAGSNNPDLGGLARTWLRAKKTELLTADRHQRHAAASQSSRVERQIVNKGVEEAVLTAFPQLRRLQQRQHASAIEREQRSRDAVLALPRARVTVDGRGRAGDHGVVELPTRIERHGDDLRIEVIALPDAAPRLNRLPFHGCQLLVPEYRGPGSYDVAATARRREAQGDPYDYLDWSVALGSLDEAYYWTPDIGPAVIEVAPDERSVRARLSMQGAGGDLEVSLGIDLLPV